MRGQSATRQACTPRIWPALLLAAFATACSTTPPGNPDDPDLQAFAADCSICHALPHPKRHTYPQWQALVAAMDSRRQERGMPPLDEDQRRAVLAYLKQHAR